MRGIIGIKSRREIQLLKGPGVYCSAVIKGQETQAEFGCYDIKIQPHLQINTEVDVEWDEKPGKPFNDQPTTQRTIRQLYIDGKPVIEKQQGKGFGGGYKDSPETRASIEAQTAVNAVVDLLEAKVITLDHSLAQKAIAWLDARIPASAPKQPESKPASSELGQLFRKACVAAGYKVGTPEGIAEVKAWMKKAGKTEMKFDELSPEKQGDLINMMKAQELPK